MTNNDYDSQLPVIISDIYHNWRKAIDAIAKRYGMTRTQWHIIGKLYCRGPKLSQAELSELLGINNAQLTRTLHQLEDKGIIRRFHDKNNRRSNFVELTEPNADYIQAVDAINININNQILASLPLEDQKHILLLLDHIRSVTTQLSSTQETPHDNIT
jgi:DNA-binding MarR family transcriptional regulator